MPAGVKPYRPRPMGRAQQREAQVQKREANLRPAPPAPVVGRGGGRAASAARPGTPNLGSVLAGASQALGLPKFAGAAGRVAQAAPAALRLGGTALGVAGSPIAPYVTAAGQAGQALQNNPYLLPFALNTAGNTLSMAGLPQFNPYLSAAAEAARWGGRALTYLAPPLPRYGAQKPVRQGVMTKARAPVTARPYVQLEPPPEEAAADSGLGAEPYYPYPDYGGGGETGGGYGGYGDGGGGGGGTPRELPPWYYGLISWRF